MKYTGKTAREVTDMKKIEIADLNLLVSASEPQYSPDGRYLAFTVTTADPDENGYRNNLWLKKEGETQARQLTFSGRDSLFLWQDTETLLFASVRSKEDEAKAPEEKTCFYRLNVTGGEAYKAFEIGKTVASIRQVKPGLYCLGVCEDRNALPETCSESERMEEKDYHVIDEVPVWGNGRGFVSGIRTSLYVYAEEDNSLKRLSGPDMEVAGIDISGSRILCRGKDWKHVLDTTDSILLYDLETGDVQTLLEQGKLMVSHALFFGEELILVGTDMKPYGLGQFHDFYRYNREEKSWDRICECGMPIGGWIATDCSIGGGSVVIAQEGKLWAIGQDRYRNHIYQIVEAGDAARMEVAFSWSGMITGMAKHGQKTAFVGLEANGLPEVYEILEDGLHQITNLNDAFLAEHFVSKVKYIPFVNRDGVSIDGWVLEPYGFDKEDTGRTWPGVLEIHGGPRGTYAEIFFHEMQVMASRGWFVFYCNPRGSEGYGEEFADLRGKYGTIDYEDLMAFTDHVLELYPQIDPGRLGATGGSYGGFMCNWIEGHTDRFAAIASQRSVSNWVSDFGCSEIGIFFNQNELLATPWSSMERMWEVSPLKYAHNAKTPILFVHSMCDYNCTIDQGIQMFTAMKYFGVPSRMCLFEEENHELSRSGKPKHRMRRLREIADWFEKYLVKAPEASD